jgi:hypothetical protein
MVVAGSDIVQADEYRSFVQSVLCLVCARLEEDVLKKGIEA